MVFQSTLPTRGATVYCNTDTFPFLFQSTLPTRGATHFSRFPAPAVLFQSTLPTRGATFSLCRCNSDGGHFNPRSPHGERLNRFGHRPRINAFQSTLPTRGATFCAQSHSYVRRTISIHAPHTGSDGCSIGWFLTQLIFQSTLPARGATVKVSFAQPNKRISIHAPRTGSDGVRRLQAAGGDDFNPRSPHGERLRRWREKSCKM